MGWVAKLGGWVAKLVALVACLLRQLLGSNPDIPPKLQKQRTDVTEYRRLFLIGH